MEQILNHKNADIQLDIWKSQNKYLALNESHIQMDTKSTYFISESFDLNFWNIYLEYFYNKKVIIFKHNFEKNILEIKLFENKELIVIVDVNFKIYFFNISDGSKKREFSFWNKKFLSTNDKILFNPFCNVKIKNIALLNKNIYKFINKQIEKFSNNNESKQAFNQDCLKIGFRLISRFKYKE